jgi:membrane protease YdiL (CAAX protease family)
VSDSDKLVKREKGFLIVEMLLLFSAFFMPGLFADVPEEGKIELYMIYYCLYSLPQILLMIYIIWNHGRTDLSDFGIKKVYLKDLLIIFASFSGVIAFVFLLIFIIFLLPQNILDSLSTGYQWQSSKPLPVVLILIFSLTTGYREELFFRAYLLARARQIGIMPVIGLFLTTLLFMAFHFYEGIMGLIISGFLGLGFGLLFLKFQNLHIIAISHALYNFFILYLAQMYPVY